MLTSGGRISRRTSAAELARKAAGRFFARRGSTVWQPNDHEIIERFHQLYYDRYKSGGGWLDTRWLGVPAFKCPLDLWVYQELLFEVRPDLVIETGTMHGGSALFLAATMDAIGHGRVITVDVSDSAGVPRHPRVTFLRGSSTSAEVLERLYEEASGSRSVMVILDSDHRAAHVLHELHALAGLVTVGSYVIVEDTNVNGHPVFDDFGPGPAEAVTQFLSESSSFIVDERCERHLLTFNPGGYLRRIG